MPSHQNMISSNKLSEKNASILSLDPSFSSSDDLIDDEIFIQFKDGSLDHIGYLEEKYGVIPLEKYPSMGLALFHDEGFRSVRTLVNDPLVEIVWGNHIVNMPKSIQLDTENDFIDFNKEIRATELKNKGINGSSVTIAFIDTGVDITGQISGGDLDDFDENSSTSDYKFFGATSLAFDDPFYYMDFSGRGTWHAGLACGTGYYNKTFEGVAPGAKYLSIKVYDPFGLTYYSSLISGVEWAIRNSADIILFSADLPGLPNDPISKACDKANDHGILVVAPSGNEGSSYMSVSSPGHSLKALTVGAYDSFTGNVAEFSSRGPILFDFRQGVDLIAPGVGLVGTRAQLLPSGTLEAAATDMFPRPTFGDIIQENYSRASGTSGAAAIVAGAAALLLQEFPQASPEALRIALTSTAVPITGDRSAEGSGLIDVAAARKFLREYFQSKSVDVFPIPSQAIYTGMISASDTFNISENPNRPENWTAIDTMFLYTTHSLGSVLIVNQTDFVNSTDLHLLLSVWGISYNGKFQWLPEFKVLKEFYQVTLRAVGNSQYWRYAGILSNEEVYIVTAIDTWSYTDDQQQRMAAFNYEFTVINVGEEVIENLSISNVCKADLYLSEYDLEIDDSMSLMEGLNFDFALDDVLSFNASGDNIFLLTDSITNRSSAEYNTTSIGFGSSTHVPTQWEINDFLNILLNLTMQEQLRNVSDYLQGIDDPAWGVTWNLISKLEPTVSQTFEAEFAIGLGNTSSESEAAVRTQFQYLHKNVTTGDIIDLQIIEPSFQRVVYLNEKYRSSARVLNIGTIPTNQTDILFLVNRSNQANRFELFVVVQQFDYMHLFEYFNLDAEWFPIYEDTYTLAWVATVIQDDTTNITQIAELAGIAEALPAILPDILASSISITSYVTRNCVVVNGAYYRQITPDFARATPSALDMAPMVPYFPGDVAFWNLTYISIHNMTNVRINVRGSVGTWVSVNRTFFDILTPFTTNMITLSVPMLAAPGKYELMLEFWQRNEIFLEVTLEFILHAVTGRVIFDGIHNNITISLTGEELNFGWDERLDTPYGNFYDLKELWASTRNFNLSGTSMMPLMSGMDINLTEMGLDMSEMSEMQKFLPDSLKGFTFRGDLISTSYLDLNILQLGDILVLSDPESSYSSSEIENITTYVENGGVVFFWIEPENENNWTTINHLLYEFGLEINTTSNNSEHLVPIDISSISRIESTTLDLLMANPVSFKPIDEENAENISLISDYISLIEYGRGKLCVIGDKDLFNNTGLTFPDNRLFAQELLKWALIKQAEVEINIQNWKIEHGDSVYFDIEMLNYFEMKPYLDEGYIWIYSFMHEDGYEVNITSSSSNISFSLNPVFPGEPGRFLASFTSKYTNLSGTIYVIFYFDHVALTSNIYFASFYLYPSVIPEPTPYEYPQLPYEHLFDFVLLTSTVTLFLIQRQYRSSKWGRRFRIVELKDIQIRSEVQTYLAEAEMLSKSLSQALIHSKYSELERIRFLLRIRRRMIRLLQNIKKFGDRLGEV